MPRKFYSRLLACTMSLIFFTRISAQQKIAAGDWLFSVDYFGNQFYQTINLSWDAGILVAKYIGDSSKLICTSSGNNILLKNTQPDSSYDSFKGVLNGEEGSGKFISYNAFVKDSTISTWKARRLNSQPPQKPHRIEFVPTSFQRAFSSAVKPVLTVWPKDTVHTESVDAGGYDKNGVTRVMGGNPLTGPFYVETALPGDVLAITITRLRLNRSWALSGEVLVDRVVTYDYAQKIKPTYESVKWNLDLVKGTASPAKPHDHMKNFSVPVKPMLGCVGLAPGFGSPPIRTGDSGPFGGNMDFNMIGEGATVYLPVRQPGALLYLGDAHALQGDGELTGDALETSMDIEFAVDVIKGDKVSLSAPRVENADYIMAVGLSGSLDVAIKEATSELAAWLEHDYKLKPEETAQVLGTCIEYNIGEVADRNVGVVAKIRKKRLADLHQ